MIRYLLNIEFLSYLIKAIDENKFNEFRVIYEVLDYLLKGRLERAGDIFMQDFKSVGMNLRDHHDRFDHYQ